MALAMCAALLVHVSHASPAPPDEQTRQAYIEGRQAFFSGEYRSAAEKLRQATAGDGREELNSFRWRGLNEEDYLPFFYLGLTLEKTGDAPGARRALEESLRQGAVEGRASLGALLHAALGRVRPPTPAPTATPVPAQPGPSSDALVAAATATPSVSETASPPEGGGPVPLAPASSRPEEAAAARFERLRASAVAPPVAWKVTPPPVHVPPAPGPPAADGLRTGFFALFAGRYEEAEAALAALGGESPEARGLLALALASRYLAGGEREPEILARAREEMLQARAGGARLPRARDLSPRVRRLLGIS
ncbi:MAG: hypothetical protein EDX89_24355 [Acidobacteria bacterium]|nr:MAG: hypothetical protein EDX89_24355 [Acidobacteriota bacterium]MCE7958693.1 hypothetical protein [Acidobacteria bacterium ACB2]